MKKYISCDFLSFDMFFETPSAGHPVSYVFFRPLRRGISYPMFFETPSAGHPYPMFFEILHRVGQGVGSE